MNDFNVYFESQDVLSHHPDNVIVAETAKNNQKPSELIEQSELVKENLPSFTYSNEDDENSSTSSNEKCFSSGDEYNPQDEMHDSSGEESEVDVQVPSTSKISTNRTKSRIRKYLDDGNVDRFHLRIEEWKSKKRTKSTKLKSNSEVIDDVDQSNKNRGTNVDTDNDYHRITGGLKIPNCIWEKLFRYQKTGVKWLWELHQIESGGLLGDEMGLGKTVQIIAFLAGLSVTGGGEWGGLGPTLIVAPATVLHQWVQHFHQWWPPVRVAVLHNSGSFRGAPDRLIRDIYNTHGILVTTYSGIVSHKDSIEARKWQYVILDEGHKIRNSDTKVSMAVRRIRTPHRIVVTGSPMQNNLQELWSIFDFMSPGLLGTLPAFVEHFANPITQGGYTNATKLQETLALSLATTLKNVITPYILRRTKAEVKDHLKLPEKKEQVLFCSLSTEQRNLYESFLLGNTVRSILDKESRYGDPMRARILVALCSLRKICNHPDLYTCEVDEDIPDETLPDDKSFGFWRKAGKMIVINSLLKIWKKQGHRTLIFTQSRAMVYILEIFLQQNDYKYLKMDGSTGIGSRQPLISLFNSDDSYLVFLATTRVGGLGVNLTGADRVIIYDPDWNPAIDSQAKERAWRIGQNRDVTIYRLLSAGTIEEKIYQRQVFKQLLGNKVFLDPNQKNYLKTSTLQGLFSLEIPDKSGSTETTTIFKHTQIKPNQQRKPKNDNVLLNGGVSFSKSKMDAMRRLAQQISKQISSSSVENDKTITCEEDPRERYKRKIQPPPPVPDMLPVNMVNDIQTNANFSSILSEIDIVNMYSKTEPLDFLKFTKDDQETSNDDKEITLEDGEIVEEDITVKETDKDNSREESGRIKSSLATDSKKTFKSRDLLKSSTKKADDNLTNNEKHLKRHKGKRKHKNVAELLKNDGLSEDEELLQSIKKVKSKKVKLSPEVKEDPDQYVLEKLFAKSGVQSALQHDKVVGLAEREECHRMQTATQAKATMALKALRKSKLKNWRW